VVMMYLARRLDYLIVKSKIENAEESADVETTREAGELVTTMYGEWLSLLSE
jgi:hypothetical protein